NAQDAVFCFIDGLIVDQRAGLGPHKYGKIVLEDVGSLIELKAGVHPIELHHVMGTNPSSHGFSSLMWVTPESKKIAFVPADNFVQAPHGQVMAVDAPNKNHNAAVINLGIEAVLTAGQTELYLARFEASGHIADESKIVWDFGDGTKGTG